MSKGNLFVGSASGKVGNLVLANTKAGQITKAYQPNVSNPKTPAQMKQRAKFANAVKFFKQSVANFYQFAYEDKRQNESYYNAFMRHNIKNSVPMSRGAYLNNAVPALGDKWLMADGRLQSLTVVNSNGEIAVSGTFTYENPTVATLSADLIKAGYETGDIVTMVRITTSVNASNIESVVAGTTQVDEPSWLVAQFVIDPASTLKLSEVKAVGQGATNGAIEIGVSSTQFSLPSPQNALNANFGAAVVTRKVENGLYASPSYLIGDSIANALVENLTSESAVDDSIKTWKASSTAILKGAIAGKS